MLSPFVSQAVQCAHKPLLLSDRINSSFHPQNTQRAIEGARRRGRRVAMSDDSGRRGVSEPVLRSSDDRKSHSSTSSAAAFPAAPAATAPPDLKITLKSADMKEEMRQDAFDYARAAFDKHTVEKEIAEYIKKEFDKRHGATWHCIVGKNFGSYVTHETNYFVYFYINSKAVLLFKSG